MRLPDLKTSREWVLDSAIALPAQPKRLPLPEYILAEKNDTLQKIAYRMVVRGSGYDAYQAKPNDELQQKRRQLLQQQVQELRKLNPGLSAIDTAEIPVGTHMATKAPPVGDAAPATAPGRVTAQRVKAAQTPQDRAGMYEAMETGVLGGPGQDILQRVPPLSWIKKGETLDAFRERLGNKDLGLGENSDTILLFTSRHVSTGDQMWINQVERKGSSFTVHMQRAGWNGPCQKNPGYHAVFAVDLGKLAEGKYTAEWVIDSLLFGEEGPDGWPTDAKPDPEAKQITPANHLLGRRQGAGRPAGQWTRPTGPAGR